MLSCLKISIPSNSLPAINSSKRLRRFPNSFLSKCSGIFLHCNWIKFLNIQVHRKNDRPYILIFSTHKNNGPLLTLGLLQIQFTIKNLRTTPVHTDSADPIRHKKFTYHSSPYGLLQIQFAIKNLRTTPVHTDYCRSNLP